MYLFVAHKDNQPVYSANAFHKLAGFTTPIKVWSYGIVTLEANNSTTFPLTNFFATCNVRMKTTLSAKTITVKTIASANKPGAPNPPNINGLDLYLLITRTFTLAF